MTNDEPAEQTASSSMGVDALLPLYAPPIQVDIEVDTAGMQALMAHTEKTWTRLGEEEPHWSVISVEQFRQEHLQDHREAFYASGQADVGTFLAFLVRNGVDPDGLKHVMEYGCGVGRVTRYLAQRFDRVTACDISPSHLHEAEVYLRACSVDNVRWQRITGINDLDGTRDLDAVFSIIVLQHNPPPAMAAILERLLRRLRPGGVAYIQVPTHATDYSFSIDDYMAQGLNASHVEMHYLPQRHVFRIARDNGCEALEVREDNWIGRRDVSLSNTFLLRKL